MELQMISVKREVNTNEFNNVINQKNLSTKNRKVRRKTFHRGNRMVVLVILALLIGIGFTCSVLRTNAMASGIEDNIKTYKYYSRVYVESGDTLWEIAEEYTDGSISEIQSCIDEIRTINNMNSFETLKSGSYITVPYYSSEYIDI